MKNIVAASVVLLAALPLFGCAKDPSKIEAVAMPTGSYTPMSCSQLTAEHKANADNLELLSKRQKQAVTGDAVGVFLFGVPTSSLAGHDLEPEIAAAKGRQEAIEAEQLRKGC